ncbi:hypothetical protein PR202_ga07188 [Eleusine coracana subsp. coracana]|uniref:Uncharacterized protein n=1 Tax=Eleusine coracana subsp. coracana TaxID=191504 RepID=A0AAV5BZF3_ELECO|nr:hypothetical protein PR202_ga07188 [Eleusine coracana subsp. coracana]
MPSPLSPVVAARRQADADLSMASRLERRRCLLTRRRARIQPPRRRATADSSTESRLERRRRLLTRGRAWIQQPHRLAVVDLWTASWARAEAVADLAATAHAQVGVDPSAAARVPAGADLVAAAARVRAGADPVATPSSTRRPRWRGLGRNELSHGGGI